jgi:hypothetical protein
MTAMTFDVTHRSADVIRFVRRTSIMSVCGAVYSTGVRFLVPVRHDDGIWHAIKTWVGRLDCLFYDNFPGWTNKHCNYKLVSSSSS